MTSLGTAFLILAGLMATSGPKVKPKPCLAESAKDYFPGLGGCDAFTAAKVFCEAQCRGDGHAHTLCLNAETGQKACGTDLQPPLTGGTRIRVALVATKGWVGKYTLAVESVKSADSLFEPDGTALADEAPPYKVVTSTNHTVSSDPSESAVRVHLVSDGQEGKPVDVQLIYAIDHGLHFVELGVLIAVIPNGSRTLLTTPVPGSTGDFQVSFQQDLSIRPAFALNIFPFGRRNGSFSPFQLPVTCTRFWADFIGIQVAADFDFTRPFSRFFLGLVTEWISGASLNFGVAFVQGDFLPPGYQQGTFLGPNEVITPRVLFMVRPYLGITLTTALIDAIRDFKAR
jgi:hypothetical protein